MKYRLKILMINKYYFIKGGSERCFFDLKALLESKGHEVIPFAMADDQNVESKYDSYFVDSINYDFDSKLNRLLSAPKVFGRMTYSLHAKRKIEELLSKEKFDVAHLHMIEHQISPSILHSLKKFNVPVVQTVHQYKAVCPNYRMYIPQKGEICERCLSGNYFNAVKQRCHKESLLASAMIAAEMTIHKWMKIYKNNIDTFIVPSKFMGLKLAQGGIPEYKIKLIYHFIETDNYPFSLDHEDYFVYLGRLSEEKGLFTLLRAVAKLPEAKLKIIGDGPLRNDLEKFSDERDLKNVEFLGKMFGDDLKKAVSKAMFVVIPSEWYENSPMVIYESFAMGKPLIGAKTGGITELIRHKVDGLLYEMGNVEELAKCIDYMLTHKEIIPKFGEAGRARVKSEFNPESHYEQVLNIYESLIPESNTNGSVKISERSEGVFT